MAIKLPNGKLYPVGMDGDKTMINIPGNGEMQVKILFV